MAYVTALVLFRGCLPACILLAAIIRPSLLSAIYCVLLFVTPLLEVPTRKSMQGATGVFLKVLLGVAILGTLLQGSFHLIIALQKDGYSETIKECSREEMIYRNLGFVMFGKQILIQTAALRMAPEIIMLMSSIGFFIIFRSLTRDTSIQEAVESVEAASLTCFEEETKRKKYVALFLHIARYGILILFCLAAILWPSATGGIYFTTFLFWATWWACCRQLERSFGIFLFALAPIVLVHICVLYIYQSEFMQMVIQPNSMQARLAGLVVLAEMGCRSSNFTGDPRQIVYNAPWHSYLYAVVLFILFYSMVLMGRELIRPEAQIRLAKSAFLTHEDTPLIGSPSKRYGSVKKSTSGVSEEIALSNLSLTSSASDYKTPIFDSILYIVLSIVNTIMKVSYLGTNIIMMAWSITFTCWISFILLIWANFLWLVPHQRKAMLGSSPYLIIYISCTLVASYIFSLDLTEEEFPRDYHGVNMKEIGLQRESFRNLAIKCIFTVMFWITLRQYMQEKIVERQTSALADMVAPLKITVGAATTGEEAEKAAGVKLMDKLAALLVRFLTKFWIWVVAGTLFGVAITGQRMTGFRITYMALFLLFLLTFQLSFKLWRRIMFGFWLIVILFATIVLVATYTYQFDNFSSYWSSYLHVDKELQLDIGLQVFETKELFIRLLVPTFFLIVTVIQLHYFHNDFMKFSDPKTAGTTVDLGVDDELNQSSLQGGAYSDKTAKDDTTTDSGKYKFSELNDYKHKKGVENFLRMFNRFTNKFFVFLEIHMLKLVLFFALLCCIKDSCAVYSYVVVMLSLGFIFGRTLQLFTIYSTSLLVAFMLLMRMVFQISYVRPEIWDVNCTGIKVNQTVNYTGNLGAFLGFRKTDNLIENVKWNIIYLLVMSLYSVVLVRQYYHRLRRGMPTRRAFFMFPNVKRADAEKNLKNMLKYLMNYGFYKFGVEVSLIAMVGYIGIRMDAYALAQALWLLLLFFLSRKQMSKVWLVYLVFTAVLLPIQYGMVLGLPFTICPVYPWSGSQLLLRLQEWAYLMSVFDPPPPAKLVCDFLLLLIISRQWVVFRIEKRYSGKNYAGGHNDSIIHLADREEFENPVPDFVTYVRSYLDIAKRMLLQSMFWLTLAIGFLAGTNRVNIFSVGYLMGSFFFLWQGTDIYLKPISRIIKAWRCFILYTVIVIVLKTAFQLIGCVYAQFIPHSMCWLMNLFGVGCVRKFGNIDISENFEDLGECEIKEEYLGLLWDGLCFGFLIMQLRLFNSFNFLRIVDDTKAATILASRGAELMEEMRIKRMNEQVKTEQAVIEKIRLKMDRIKATQQKMQEKQPSLARAASESSCTSATSQGTTPAGYHTPIEEEEPAPLTPRSSLIQPQAPSSPFSAVMTVSLEGYLEPQRISFSSPPNSELNPRPVSPDESFPVFSPPPYDEAPPYAETVPARPAQVQRQTSIGPPWMHGCLVTPRQSVISHSSRSHLSHHESAALKDPTTYDWRTEPTNHYEDSLNKTSGRNYKRSEPKTYKEAIRSGDYYMFEDLEIDEIDILPEQTEKEEEKQSDIPTLTEFVHDTLHSDMATIVKQRKRSWKRRKTIPLTRTQTTRSSMSAPPAGGVPQTKSSTPRSVTIRESDIKPSTSQEEDDELSDISESDMSDEKETHWTRIVKYCLFIWAFIESAMLSLTNFCSRYTRGHRYVMKILSQEKKILKEQTRYTIGKRIGSQQIWQPAGSYHELLGQSSEDLSNMSMGPLSPPDSFRLGLVAERIAAMQNSENDRRDNQLSISDESDTKAMASPLPYTAELERGTTKTKRPSSDEEEMSQYDQPVFYRLLLAQWYIILRHTEVLCYFIIFLNQAQTATFLSIPLPIMVFFWGTLTIPRPSKTFWVTIIAYTEVTVLIKCLFQLDIVPWNEDVSPNHPFYPPKVIGIERQPNYAIYDLLLLLVVFFHRMMLKNMGIWTTITPPQNYRKDGEYNLINEQQVLSEASADKSNPEEGQSVSAKSIELEPCNQFAHTFRLSAMKYVDTFKCFARQLLDPRSRVVADVYTFMFLCDFTNFLVLIFGFSSFGGQQYGDVTTFVKENKIPRLFLFMLMLQFFLIIVDRGIYLRKHILGKLIFQIIQVLFLHIWLFILFPILTEKEFTQEVPPQVFYIIKCIYFLLSAYQIRCGYPSRTLGNFLCKGFGLLNMVGFKAFILCPFVFELRAIMDWMWTETSMSLFDWIKMEDIFAHVFYLKCERKLEEDYPQARGTKKGYLIKYVMGGFFLLCIVLIIWLPLILFSMMGSVGISSVPTDVSVELRIGQYPPIYHMSAQGNALHELTESDYSKFLHVFNKEKKALEFFSLYTAQDAQAAHLSLDSASLWLISPPDRQKMVEEVKSSRPLHIRLDIVVTRDSAGHGGESNTNKFHVDVTFPPSTEQNHQKERDTLFKMLNSTEGSREGCSVPFILPKFLKVSNTGELNTPGPIMQAFSSHHSSSNENRNLTISLLKTASPAVQEWWHVEEMWDDINDQIYKSFLSSLPQSDCNKLVLYTFSDRTFPKYLSIITGGGIIGVYGSLVYILSRVLRGLFAEQVFKIMYEDLPNVDRIVQLCLDVYLVREAREFLLEEDLFAKLIFLFRSPETLIKWTRPPEEVGDEDEDGDIE